MSKEEKDQYVKLLLSLGVDYQMGKTSWEVFIKTLDVIVTNLKKYEAKED